MLMPSVNGIKSWIHINTSRRSLPWHLVCDVDGVLTDGKFLYSSHGKEYKNFGAHDAEALKTNTFFGKVTFISADERGFEISLKRVQDMGFQLELVAASERQKLIMDLKRSWNVAFIGDSYSDIPSMREADLSAAPNGSVSEARRAANIRLKSRGGEGAAAEFLHLFQPFSRSVKKEDF